MIDRKARIFGGRLVCGWTIAYPTLGTNMQYRVTSEARPGERHDFRTEWQAEQWCERHDVSAESMAWALAQTR